MDLTAAKALLYCALGLFVLIAWARELPCGVDLMSQRDYAIPA